LELNKTTVRSKNPVLELSNVLRLAAKAVSHDWKPKDLGPKKVPKRARPDCQPKKGRALRKPVRPAFVQEGLDPHCSSGIIDAEMKFCCMKDCGECDDRSDVCKAKATNGRGSTCCPEDMRAETALPSCENSYAPCGIPKSVRAAPDVDAFKSADGVRNALEDCNEAIPDEQARQLLSTHFLEFESKALQNTDHGPTTSECGEYGALEAAAAACNRKDDCLGFTVEPPTGDQVPKCLLLATAHVEFLEDSSSQTTYLKKEDLAGNSFHFRPEPWEPCSKSCDTGATTRELKCLGSSGVTFNLGMCSTQVAMNADALPATEGECNVFQCSYDTEDEAPPDMFVAVDQLVHELEELHAPPEIVNDLMALTDNLAVNLPSTTTTSTSTTSTTSTTTTSTSTSTSTSTTTFDAYYYYVCGSPYGYGPNEGWYLSNPDLGGMGQNVHYPCTVGLQTNELYLVGEWGSGTEIGVADFMAMFNMWDFLERSFTMDGRPVMGPEDCFPAVEQASAVFYIPMVYGYDQWECENIYVPEAWMMGQPLGICTYVVGAVFDAEFYSGDATWETMVDKNMVWPIPESDIETYGYSCSKGKMFAANKPLLYGFGWDVISQYGASENYVMEVNDRYTGEFERFWRYRKEEFGGYWAYPHWWYGNGMRR